MRERHAREPDAVELGVRALGARDLSEAALGRRLERDGVAPAEREAAVERLRDYGYVDDERFARARAAALASRAAGDSLIAHDLERHGIDPELAAAAIAALEPEPVRAAAVVAERGDSLRTARYLASKGFDEDAIEGVVASLRGDRLG
jgi:regulatory protein